MFRIDHPSAAAVLPAPSAAGTPGYFQSPAIGSGIPPTVVTQDWLNTQQEELMAIILYAGLTPDKANNAQVLAALLATFGSPAAAADLWAGTDNSKFATALALKQAMVAQTLTDASTIAWDMNLGFRAKVTLGGNRTLGQPTHLQEGVTGSLQLTQDATGSRLLSYASCWDFRKVGAPTLSTGAGKKDIFFFAVTDAVTPLITVTASLSA